MIHTTYLDFNVHITILHGQPKIDGTTFFYSFLLAKQV